MNGGGDRWGESAARAQSATGNRKLGVFWVIGFLDSGFRRNDGRGCGVKEWRSLGEGGWVTWGSCPRLHGGRLCAGMGDEGARAR